MANPASFVTAASTNDVNTFTSAQTFTGGVSVTGGISGGVRQVLPFGMVWSATAADASIAVEIET